MLIERMKIHHENLQLSWMFSLLLCSIFTRSRKKLLREISCCKTKDKSRPQKVKKRVFLPSCRALTTRQNFLTCSKSVLHYLANFINNSKGNTCHMRKNKRIGKKQNLFQIFLPTLLIHPKCLLSEKTLK